MPETPVENGSASPASEAKEKYVSEEDQEQSQDEEDDESEETSLYFDVMLAWLRSLGLERHARRVWRDGWRSPADLRTCTEEDLKGLGMTRMGEIRRLMQASKELAQSRRRFSASVQVAEPEEAGAAEAVRALHRRVEEAGARLEASRGRNPTEPQGSFKTNKALKSLVELSSDALLIARRVAASLRPASPVVLDLADAGLLLGFAAGDQEADPSPRTILELPSAEKSLAWIIAHDSRVTIEARPLLVTVGENFDVGLVGVAEAALQRGATGVCLVLPNDSAVLTLLSCTGSASGVVLMVKPGEELAAVIVRNGKPLTRVVRALGAGGPASLRRLLGEAVPPDVLAELQAGGCAASPGVETCIQMDIDFDYGIHAVGPFSRWIAAATLASHPDFAARRFHGSPAAFTASRHAPGIADGVLLPILPRQTRLDEALACARLVEIISEALERGEEQHQAQELASQLEALNSLNAVLPGFTSMVRPTTTRTTTQTKTSSTLPLKEEATRMTRTTTWSTTSRKSDALTGHADVDRVLGLIRPFLDSEDLSKAKVSLAEQLTSSPVESPRGKEMFKVLHATRPEQVLAALPPDVRDRARAKLDFSLTEEEEACI